MADTVEHVETTTLRYNYRLRPGAAAVAALTAEWHRSRWIWNQCVRAHKDRLPWINDKDLTAARSRIPWLRGGSVVAQQQTMRTFRTKGQKKFKSAKKTLPSLQYTKRGFSIRDDRLRLPAGVSIPVVWSRDLPAQPSSVRVYQDSLGHWYASFVVQAPEAIAPDTSDSIGIDWGVKEIATADHDGYDLPHSQYGKRGAAALTRYQRMMARRKPPRGRAGSKGYKAAKLGAAKAHKKVARQRQDTARKWVRRVVADHQNIAVEDFKPRVLAKSTMARKSADGAIGATKQELVEYARRVGRKVVLVPPAYTTMTCSRCFVRAKRLPLNERIFQCMACGYTAGRDRNAARVILATAGFNRADVDAVRHQDLPSGEVRVLAELGIPRL